MPNQQLNARLFDKADQAKMIIEILAGKCVIMLDLSGYLLTWLCDLKHNTNDHVICK